MNNKVQEFINKQKEKELKQKEAHLISLGLIDESKSINSIEYLDEWDGTNECKWDTVIRKYYKEIEQKVALTVTDQEYQEILKYAPITSETNHTKTIETPWANSIKISANIFLALNILAGIILCLLLANNYHTDDYAWIPIITAFINCILWYPLNIGFSIIVKLAEKKL